MVTILTAWQLVNGNKSFLSRYPSHRLENVFFEQDAPASAAFPFLHWLCPGLWGCQLWGIKQMTEFHQHKDRDKSNIKEKNKTKKTFFFLSPDFFWLILLSEASCANLTTEKRKRKERATDIFKCYRRSIFPTDSKLGGKKTKRRWEQTEEDRTQLWCVHLPHYTQNETG